MSAEGWKAGLTCHKFTWDVASSQGGAVGTIALGDLPDNFVVTHCVAVAETALTGGGSAVLGEDGGGDADGYFTDLDAIAVATPIKGSGALVNNTGAEIMHKVAAAKDGVLLTIATTAYTAGKIHFFFIGVQAD
jgi:hypothetical protein